MQTEIVKLHDFDSKNWWMNEMPTIEQVEVYNFDELSDEVQEKVLDNLRYNDSCNDDWDYLLDYFCEKFKENDFDIDVKDMDIEGRGNCYSIHIPTSVFLGRIDSYDFQVINTDGYIRSFRDYNFDVEYCGDEYDIDDDEDITQDFLNVKLEEFRGFVEERVTAMKLLLDEFEKAIQDEEDYRYSDEAIKERIDANEYRFLKDGTIWD